jgi:hypothetical protein
MAAPSNPYPLEPRGLDPAMVRNVRQASRTSSADFGLLMAEAQQESGFRSDAKAPQGSAAGLYQFVDQTWLQMVHRFGDKYGIGSLAQKISVDASGHASTADVGARQHILSLRNDPSLAASLAGEYATMNKGEVERALGRTAGAADLYMAHFLGAGGATTFLKALATKGNTAAASLLPEAAESNPSVFYDARTGRAKTVAEIYHSLGGRIEQEAQHFASLGAEPATAAGDVTDPAETAETGSETDATRVAMLAPRADFAGLKLSAPVAAMLDTLTLAAIGLAKGEAPDPRQSHKATD